MVFWGVFPNRRSPKWCFGVYSQIDAVIKPIHKNDDNFWGSLLTSFSKIFETDRNIIFGGIFCGGNCTKVNKVYILKKKIVRNVCVGMKLQWLS